MAPIPPKKLSARLERELEAITRYGYTPLFLVVADIVRFALVSDIPVSTRGSVANSLVAYCTGITTVDPIAHDLLFERFLSPARVDAPDIDLDFCSRRRDEVLEYARNTYGIDRVASVATVSTLQSRSAVRETAKAYGIEEKQLNQVLKILPHGWHPDPRRRDNRTIADVLREIADPHLEICRRTGLCIGRSTASPEYPPRRYYHHPGTPHGLCPGAVGIQRMPDHPVRSY